MQLKTGIDGVFLGLLFNVSFLISARPSLAEQRELTPFMFFYHSIKNKIGCNNNNHNKINTGH